MVNAMYDCIGNHLGLQIKGKPNLARLNTNVDLDRREQLRILIRVTHIYS